MRFAAAVSWHAAVGHRSAHPPLRPQCLPGTLRAAGSGRPGKVCGRAEASQQILTPGLGPGAVWGLHTVGSDEFVSFPVDVDNLYLVVVFQVLAQLGDIDIHRPRIEVVVVNPNRLQSEVAL